MHSGNPLPNTVWTEISATILNQPREVLFFILIAKEHVRLSVLICNFPSKFSDSLLTTYRIKHKLPCDMLRLAFKISHILAWISCFMVCPAIPFSKLLLELNWPYLSSEHILYYSTSTFLLRPLFSLSSDASFSFIICLDSNHPPKSILIIFFSLVERILLLCQVLYYVLGITGYIMVLSAHILIESGEREQLTGNSQLQKLPWRSFMIEKNLFQWSNGSLQW